MISKRASYRPSHRHLVSSSHLVPVVVSSAAFSYRAPFAFARRYLSPSRPRSSFRSSFRSPFRRRSVLRLVVVLSRFPSRRLRCHLIRRPLSQRAPFPFAHRYSFPVSFVVQAFPPVVVPVSRLIRRPVSAVVSSAAPCRLVRRSVLLVACRLVPPSSRPSLRSSSSLLSSRRLVPFLVLFSVHPSSHPVGSFHPSSLAASCAVSFARRSSLVVSSFLVPFSVPFPVSFPMSSVRPPSPFPRHDGRGVFPISIASVASKQVSRRRAGDGLGQSGESEGRGVHAMGRWQASRRADTRTPRSSYSTGGAWSVLFFSCDGGEGVWLPRPPWFFAIGSRST